MQQKIQVIVDSDAVKGELLSWPTESEVWNSGVVQVQSCPILDLVFFKCWIDEPVLRFSRWIKQHKSIRAAPTRVVFLVKGHSPGPVKNGAELVYQVLYRVRILNT